jgi:hypothetical protein
MIQKIAAFVERLPRFLGGRWGWRLVMGLFLLEALWFVFSAQYPMAFDENYHFGLIQLHAHQWLPFFTSQPPGTGAYGPIARDPSYLYHWLMSFPYRLLGLFTDNQTAQIIWLRLLNVAMFAYALVLYRKILARLGVRNALSNSLFLVFILVPVVPFLAATINYDNMFLVAVAASILLTFRVLDGLKERRVEVGSLLSLLMVLFLGCLIKFPFLPILAATVVFLGWRLGRDGLFSTEGIRSFRANFVKLSALKQGVLVLGCLLSIGLFTERYGENIVKYHNPVPSCNAVLSEDECIQYGPYGRDAYYKQTKPASFHPNIIVYAWQWLYGMWYRLFFAINYNYATQPPLLMVSGLGIAGAAVLLLGIVIRFKELFTGSIQRQLVFWVTLGYITALFLDGYKGYVKTGQPVAINGRYLIAFMPFLFAFGGMAWASLLRSRQNYKNAFSGIVLGVLLLQGAGTMTFIVRSDDTWMWPNKAVRTVNRTVRNVVSPAIIGKNIW